MTEFKERILPQYIATAPRLLKAEYVVGVEHLAVMEDEGKPLGRLQVEELFPGVTDEASINMLIRAVLHRQHTGPVAVVTLRHRIDLVGYIVYSLAPFEFATNKVAATERAAYFHPDHRKGSLFSSVLSFAADAAKLMGADVITITNRGPKGGAGHGSDISTLCERAGYKPFAVDMIKEI